MLITLGQTEVELLPHRAALLSASKTLVLADLHLGKSATFRAQGLPVPEGNTATDLNRLTAIITSKKPNSLVIAGDLFHSRDGLTSSVLKLFGNWLEQLSLPVVLTEGNHDRRSIPAISGLPFEIIPRCSIDGLTIAHDPADLEPGEPSIAGHIHPGLRITESRRNSLRVPGFYLINNRHLVLPAFSDFTGLQLVKPGTRDRFFASINDCISEIPSELIR